MAKEVFEQIFAEDVDPEAYVEEHGLKTVNDTGLLEETARKVLENNPGPVEQYKSGKTKVLGFLVGQVMKEMKGKATRQRQESCCRSCCLNKKQNCTNGGLKMVSIFLPEKSKKMHKLPPFGK